MKQYPLTTLLQWASKHPVQVILFACWFSIIPTILAFREDWMRVGLYLFVVGLVYWGVSVWKHGKIPLMLAATLALAGPSKAAEQEPPQAVGIAVGVVVICVGGVCIYKVIQFCNKKFPRSTNAPPSLTASGTDEIAGAYEYASAGSCYVPPDLRVGLSESLDQNPTTFTLEVIVNGGITTSMRADNREGTTQDWAGFAAEMAGHGLFLTGRPSQSQFARNGVPCDAGEVPLSFDPLTGRVVQGAGGDLRRVVVERSYNLTVWSPLLTTDVGEGARLAVVDTARDGQMFYRVSVMTP